MRFNLPDSFGVYIFKDKTDRPIYVGKALSIKKRVRDHFSLKDKSDKEKTLSEETVAVGAIAVDSEIEALILEANLIKKYQPKFNSSLKDDKDYLYIKITNELFPKVLTARKRDLKDSSSFFGPFPSANKVRSTLKLLRRIFPYSTCGPNQKKACLYYHLGLCPGVCTGQISESDYKNNIKNLTLFLQGRKRQVLETLEKQLAVYSKKLEFEKAEQIKKNIEAISYVTKPQRLLFDYTEESVEKVRREELQSLASTLGLKSNLDRIEGYDISNISGKQAVGSMVVFTKAASDRDEYRRFKIRTVEGINDPAMMAEVLRRRFANDWPSPDFIIVDGGKTQLNAALGVLKSLGLKIPIIGLAKRFEEIYVPNKARPIKLRYDSSALKLIQRLRDEAHRFAITYHRKLRSKEFLPARA